MSPFDFISSLFQPAAAGSVFHNPNSGGAYLKNGPGADALNNGGGQLPMINEIPLFQNGMTPGLALRLMFLMQHGLIPPTTQQEAPEGAGPQSPFWFMRGPQGV